jgi:hypothetical protein
MSYGTPSHSGPPPAYSPIPAGPSTARDVGDEIPDDFTHKVYVPVSESDIIVRLGKLLCDVILLYFDLYFNTL